MYFANEIERTKAEISGLLQKQGAPGGAQFFAGAGFDLDFDKDFAQQVEIEIAIQIEIVKCS